MHIPQQFQEDGVGAHTTAVVPPQLTCEERLERCVDRVLEQPDFPAFSAQIEEITTLFDDEDLSIRKLGDVVRRSHGLTLKVLQAANTLGSNPTGVPTFNIEQAIFRLGVNRVRAMSSGMVFFEHFQGRSDAVRELVLLSLVAANQSEVAADRLGASNPEEAYLCGMLRNMGEVLIASYCPEELAQIRAEVAARPEVSLTSVCRDVLGFTYEELGMAVASRLRMPGEVGAAMTSAPEETSGCDQKVVAITQLTHALTAAIYRSPAGDGAMRVTLLVQKFGVSLGITREMLERIASSAEAEARKILARYKLSGTDVAILDPSRSAQAFGRKAKSSACRQVSAPAVAPNTALNPRVFVRLECEVDELLRTDKGPGDVHAVVLRVLEAIHKGAGFDRAVFALVNQDRDTMHGRVAIGTNADDLRAKFAIPIGPTGGPIGKALKRHREITLRADGDLEPEGVIQLMQFGARTLSVLPLVAAGQLVGCLYYDQLELVAAPTSVMEAALRRLRDRTLQVLNRRR